MDYFGASLLRGYGYISSSFGIHLKRFIRVSLTIIYPDIGSRIYDGIRTVLTAHGLNRVHVSNFNVGVIKRYNFKMLKSLREPGDTESTGIGLAVVKKIVERNGGSVRVESEVSKGSSFYFTVPKEAYEDPASTWAGPKPSETTTE